MSEWQRPKDCSTLECIEVFCDREVLVIRTSGSPEYEIYPSHIEWAAFLAAVKAGEYDNVP